MPTIKLKPNSPDFADEKSHPPTQHRCDMPECAARGEFKAPKHRGLNEYYWFCLDHVKEYNNAWNFFDGMSSPDIEDHIRRSHLWDRPTWRYDTFARQQEHLHRKANQFYNFSEDEPEQKSRTANRDGGFMRHTPEYQALVTMGLEPPVDLTAIKTRYKQLAKQYHPDHNKDDPEAEERLKNINMAYTLLKLAYKKYEDFAD